MNDRPLTGTGSYNMGFIDWQNEWERVFDEEPELVRRLEEEALTEPSHEQKAKYKEILKRIKPMKIGKSNQQCSICVTCFEKGDKIFKLQCEHIFHKDCFEPWIKLHSNCPNCRLEL